MGPWYYFIESQTSPAEIVLILNLFGLTLHQRLATQRGVSRVTVT